MDWRQFEALKIKKFHINLKECNHYCFLTFVHNVLLRNDIDLYDVDVLLVEYNPNCFNIIATANIKIKYLILVGKGRAIYGGSLL